jgi:hypothetical protein
MYGPLGDPGSYGTARSQWEPKGFTGIEYPQAMPFSGGGGGGGGMSFGSDPWLDTMDRIDRERYEGEAEARDYYLNAQANGTVWDKPRGIQMPTLSAPRPVDTQGSLGNYQWNRPATRNYSNPTRRYGL